MGKIIPKDIEVVVGSYGGVGTTFFLDFVAQFKKTNHPQDEDKIKHLGMPPISFNKEIKDQSGLEGVSVLVANCLK